jgi:5-amino-6-(5-phosphoribosylamino)uracil reductase
LRIHHLVGGDIAEISTVHPYPEDYRATTDQAKREQLLVDRWTAPAAGHRRETLRAHYEEVAAGFDADGWIVGRKTMERHYAKGCSPTFEGAVSGRRETHIADRRGRGLAIAIDPRGKLHYGRDEADGNHLVAVLGEQVLAPTPRS